MRNKMKEWSDLGQPHFTLKLVKKHLIFPEACFYHKPTFLQGIQAYVVMDCAENWNDGTPSAMRLFCFAVGISSSKHFSLRLNKFVRELPFEFRR